MGNSGSAGSKRRPSESEEQSSTGDARPPDFGQPLQPPKRRSGAARRKEKKALLTTPDVPEALQRLIDDVNMDSVAMKLRQTSLGSSPATSPVTFRHQHQHHLSMDSSSPVAAGLTAHAFRHRYLSQRDDMEGCLEAQGIAMAYMGAERKLPTVFKWEGGGKEVYVSGTFNDWSAKIQMVKSTHNFYTIVDLPAGKHEYKFIVDGQWKSDPNQTIVENPLGTYNNVITVKPTDFQVFQALAEDVRQAEEEQRFKGRRRTVSHNSEYRRSGSPDGLYTQEIPSKNDFLWEIGSRDAPTPPLLPPQMLHVILNDDTSPHYDPNLLPEPNHVMLNHMYALSIKDGVMVLSLILRYRKKFVTTVLYKPIDSAGIPKAAPPATAVHGLATKAERAKAMAEAPLPDDSIASSSGTSSSFTSTSASSTPMEAANVAR